MGELEEKLNAILSNPEAMSQVMNLAQSLNLGGSSEPPKEDAPPEGNPENPPDLGNLGDLANLGNLLGGIDPKMIQRFLPLVSELSSGGNDEKMQLLYALRPFLRPERRDKVERAAKTAKLIHIGKKLLKSMGSKMYNRYIRNDTGQYERIPVQDPPPGEGPGPGPGPQFQHNAPPPPGGKGLLSGILEKLNLNDLDNGDLLLLFILFLLFREGADEELLIALGLLLIL